MTEKKSPAQRFLALGMILNVCLGTVYSWSVFRVPLEAALSVGSVESGLPYMVMIAVFSLTMPLAGTVLRRIGPRRTALIGGILLGVGWMLSAATTSVGVLTLFWGGLGGLGVGLTYVIPLTMAHAWFPARRGLAMGVALGGFGMSPFVTAPLAEVAIIHLGLRLTFLVVGLAFAVLVPLLASSFRMPREGEVDDGVSRRAAGSETSGAAGVPPGGLTPREMLRRREFYALWVSLFLGSIIGLGAIAITAPWAQLVLGLSAGASAVAVSLLAVFNGVGRPLFGFVTDHLGLRRTALTAFCLSGIAAVALLAAPRESVAVFAVAFAVFWLLLGGWLAIAPAATAALFGPGHYSQNYGVVFQAYGLGAVAGTLFSGSLNAIFGSYRAVLWPILLLSVTGALVALWGFRRAPRSAGGGEAA
jgi:MFS transporter, OFA family, oxalate/formate antiporter